MPDEKPKTLDEAMDAAWKDTMGEEAQELPEEQQHLSTEPVVETPKKESPPAPVEDPGTETPQPAGEGDGTAEGGTEVQSADPPQHWPETDKTMFGTLPDEAKSFLLRRHRDMEADYTRKTQENADAIKIGKAAIESIDTEIQTQLAVAGVPPEIMGIGPVPAVRASSLRTGLKLEDIDLFEMNEAFAAQAVYCQRELGIPDEKLNVNGGAIALGHPLGCTGAKLTASLFYELKRRGGRYGIVTMCIGGGQGAAGLFELAK